MALSNTNDKGNGKSYFFMYISFAFLLLVLIATGGIYYYNNNFIKKIEENNKELKETENKIEEKGRGVNYKLFKNLNKNEKTLSEYKKYSDLGSIIGKFHSLQDNFNSGDKKVVFDTFNYNFGEINTQVTMNKSTSSETAGDNTINFIKQFREKNEENNNFILGFINSFIGQDEIKFSVKLNLIKDTIKNVEDTKDVKDGKDGKDGKGN